MKNGIFILEKVTPIRIESFFRGSRWSFCSSRYWFAVILPSEEASGPKPYHQTAPKWWSFPLAVQFLWRFTREASSRNIYYINSTAKPRIQTRMSKHDGISCKQNWPQSEHWWMFHQGCIQGPVCFIYRHWETLSMHLTRVLHVRITQWYVRPIYNLL